MSKTSKSFLCSLSVAILIAGTQLDAQELKRHTTPNYRQAAQYSSKYLRQFLYSTSVSPNWIGDSDEFWYSYKTSKGTNYYRVDPARGKKEPLFDRVKLGAQLGAEMKKPVDPQQLPISRVKLNKEATHLEFVADRNAYKFDLKTEKLEKVGKASANTRFELPRGYTGTREDLIRRLRERGINTSRFGRSSGTSNASRHRVFNPARTAYVFAKGHNLFYVQLPEGYAEEQAKKEKEKKEKKEAEAKAKKEKEEAKKAKDKKSDQKSNSDDKDDIDSKDDKDNKDDKESKSDKDSKSDKEDKKTESKDKKDDSESTDKDKAKEDEKPKTLPIPKVSSSMDRKAVQVTFDGAEDYSFAGRSRSYSRSTGSRSTTSSIKETTKTRPSLVWSEDSKSFYVYRRDYRNVKELWVINSLTNPRPTLEKYPYPMPGEPSIRKSELHYMNVSVLGNKASSKGSKSGKPWDAKSKGEKKDESSKDKKADEEKKSVKVKKQDNLTVRIEPKWKDESYTNIHFDKKTGMLRFLRRDRLLRNVELCALDLKTGKTKVLFEEGFQNAFLVFQPVRYLKETGEMIWWSERSGWAHFYLYDHEGKLKNAITSGEFRASRIVKVDEKNRVLYFLGNGREKGENIYLNHLYSVRFDGTGLKLLDPGNADHRSILSKSNQYIVDNCSRVDMPPISILRDSNGKEIMKLEAADLSRLEQVGWKCPETFKVKAADGVTDLYGNIWKPFNFNPKKRYPIIAHVYPGPQQEGTRHTFSATAGEQQLAQLGFIVIQVGHRGGAPYRSKAYAAYGYFNLRDYGLADKKAAIEQLAQRHSFIDIERVGIYGHSGGGFMTAAALLREPYNDFFKVGVSTAGNHDNNIYNNSWSERYHGLKIASSRSSSRSSRSSSTRSSTRGSYPADPPANYDVSESDHFYEFEMTDDFDPENLNREYWERRSSADRSESPQLNWNLQEQEEKDGKKGDKDEKKDDDKDEKKKAVDKKSEKKSDDKKSADKKSDDKKTAAKKDDKKESSSKKDATKKDSKSKKVDYDKKFAKIKFDIKVPTNAELAKNLKGHLFLIHGELDNNVHPANTLRLVDALIKANKRFDMMYLPATRHGFGQYQPYVTQRMYEYFAEHLLDDYQSGPDIGEKQKAQKR